MQVWILDYYQSNTIMHSPYISLQQIMISMLGLHPLLMTNLLFRFLNQIPNILGQNIDI